MTSSPSSSRNGFSSVNRKNRRMASSVARKKPESVEVLIQRKFNRLRRMIPGEDRNDVETLFRETANYILFLELKVVILKRLLYGVL
uniref:Uncharacterized protein n=1 Tax=Nelumbo nucifera TaxID=4432 RepID=A0A822Y4V7_NELNU|nr:TPA_asm: hypothetical protein HUJ06_029038 [Nelumbo nucifera]